MHSLPHTPPPPIPSESTVDMIFTTVDPYNLNHECDKKLFELRKLAKFPNIFHGRQIRDHLSSFASLSICLKKNFEVLKQLVINH